MKKRFDITLYSSSALCQQDKIITHFIFDKMSINPDFTGIELENGFYTSTIYARKSVGQSEWSPKFSNFKRSR